MLILLFGALIKAALLRSFMLEEADLSYWIPIFVLWVVSLSQAIFVVLTYKEIFFTNYIVDIKGVSRGRIMFYFLLIGIASPILLNGFFLRDKQMFLVELASTVLLLPFIIYWYFLIIRSLKGLNKSVQTILINYAIFFLFIYATTSPEMISVTSLYASLLIAVIYYWWELKRVER